jgi:hypothetical protein
LLTRVDPADMLLPDMFVRFGVRRVIVAASVAVVGVASCSGSSGGTADTSPSVADHYACCQQLPSSWHPGQTVRLVWTVPKFSQQRLTSNPGVTLAARLTGPYRSLTANRIVKPAVRAYAIPVHPSDAPGEPPGISILAIPAGASPGVYHLTWKSSDSWGSNSSTIDIRVTN